MHSRHENPPSSLARVNVDHRAVLIRARDNCWYWLNDTATSLWDQVTRSPRGAEWLAALERSKEPLGTQFALEIRRSLRRLGRSSSPAPGVLSFQQPAQLLRLYSAPGQGLYFRPLGAGALIVYQKNRSCYGLNSSAFTVWRLLSSGAWTLGRLAEAVSHLFPVEFERAAEDLEGFLMDLFRAHLIGPPATEVRSEGGRPPNEAAPTGSGPYEPPTLSQITVLESLER